MEPCLGHMSLGSLVGSCRGVLWSVPARCELHGSLLLAEPGTSPWVQPGTTALLQAPIPPVPNCGSIASLWHLPEKQRVGAGEGLGATEGLQEVFISEQKT